MKKRAALLGSIFGIFNIFISMICSIVVRKLFVVYLGTEYLGLSAVFSSILGVLVILDGGVAGSMFYRIYKPLADNDNERISAVFHLTKIVYLARSVLVFLVGFAAMAFLPRLCRGSTFEMQYIYKIYMLQLVLSSASYFYIFYSFFVEAIQKRHIVALVTLAIYCVTVAAQIVCLIKYKSFVIYTLLHLLQPLTVYFVCRRISFSEYPMLRKKVKLSKGDFRDLPQMFKMVIHSLGTVVATYTDSFLITTFVGLNTLGLYDNYKVILGKVRAFLDQFTASIKDPMRLLMAEGDKEKAYGMLRNLNFFMNCTGGICSILFCAMISPFVQLWLGESYLMSSAVVATSGYTLFLSFLNYITVDIYYYNECYQRDKVSPIIEITVNLVISFVAGKYYGIPGVLFGTVLYYFSQEILRTRKLFVEYFESSPNRFLLEYADYGISVAAFIWLASNVQTMFSINNPVWAMVINGIAVSSLFFAYIWFRYRKDSRYVYFQHVATGIIDKLMRRSK